jgi:biotin operon repressor
MNSSTDKMNSIQQTKGEISSSWSGLGPVVPMPSIYLDEIMPILSDTEWRLLCVVIRQTIGWVSPANFGERKERDWITQSQFREKTGKSRDSVSLAIASLVDQGLIIVEDRHGAPLPTPRSRQSNRDRLYFRLAPIPTVEEPVKAGLV